MTSSTSRAMRDDATGDVIVRREAFVRPASFRESDNSIEVCWSLGAAGLRFDWEAGGYYIEELSMKPQAVRLERLNAGATLLDTHDGHSLKSVIGSVSPGTAKVANGEGLARVRLAKTADVADTVAKIIDGHIRFLSVAYRVHAFTRTERAGDHPHMLATDWEPTEISMVAVPFDAGAQVRSRSAEMPTIITEENEPEVCERSDKGGKKFRPLSADQIREVCSRSDQLSRSFERGLLEEHEEHPFTETQLRHAINEEIFRVNKKPSIDVRGGTQGEPEDKVRMFADVLHARLAGTSVPDNLREYQGASIVDIARSLLEQRGERMRWARPAAVIDAICRFGAHTSSDFAGIIQNAGARFLIDTYSAVPSPLKTLAKKRDFKDFKARFSVSANGPAVLRLVEENAEFKRVTFGTGSESMQLGTYGEIFAITRQALINDDLHVFAEMARFWARAQAETEASFLVGLIQGTGVTMSDGNPLYHTSHGNVAATPAAISVTSLAAARQQMRGYKNADGVTPLNVVPKYLVVGPAKETEAEQVLASITADAPANVNPFSGKLELVVDPRLIGNSWRLFADPNLNPVLEYGNLEGQDGLFTDTRIGFDVDGVEFKARTDIGAGAVDYRGTLYNAGN